MKKAYGLKSLAFAVVALSAALALAGPQAKPPASGKGPAGNGVPGEIRRIQERVALLSGRVDALAEDLAGRSWEAEAASPAPMQECYRVRGDAACAGTYYLKGVNQVEARGMTNYFPLLLRTDGKYVLTVPAWQTNAYAVFCSTNLEERWVGGEGSSGGGMNQCGGYYQPEGTASGTFVVDPAYCVRLDGQGIPEEVKGVYWAYPNSLWFFKDGSDWAVCYEWVGWYVIEDCHDGWFPAFIPSSPLRRNVLAGAYAPVSSKWEGAGVVLEAVPLDLPLQVFGY